MYRDKKYVEKLSEMCVEVHSTSATEAEIFSFQLMRNVYTTPKNYLDLIKLYERILTERLKEFSVQKQNYMNGQLKLLQANKDVDKLAEDLKILNPLLIEKFRLQKELQVRLNRDK